MADRLASKISGTRMRDDELYKIERRNRHWAVIDRAGELVCLTVYKRGAKEVVRRLSPPV